VTRTIDTCPACHIIISISQYLNTFYLMPRCCSEAWKHRNTITGARKKMGIFWGFFWRLHTKNHRKSTLFRKVSYKKPKIGTLVTTEFGGGRYQSSIEICRGPGRAGYQIESGWYDTMAQSGVLVLY
jgi:hypothetical protein